MSVFVCLAVFVLYASACIKTDWMEVGARVCEGVLTSLCLPHTRVWSASNLPTVNQEEATQVGNHQAV